MSQDIPDNNHSDNIDEWALDFAKLEERAGYKPLDQCQKAQAPDNARLTCIDCTHKSIEKDHGDPICNLFWGTPIFNLNKICVSFKEIVDALPKKFTDDDIGNGERFARYNYEKIKWIGDQKAWYYWDGIIWREDRKNVAVKYAKKTARTIDEEVIKTDDDKARSKKRNFAEYSQSKRGWENMIESGKDLLAGEINDFDNDPMQLNVLNGVIDLRTGSFRPHTHMDNFMKCAPIEYDRDAPIPVKTLKFIKDIMSNGDIERGDMEAYLIRVIGYLITGKISEQCMFILHGEGANGKTTLLNLLSLMFGTTTGYVQPAPSSIFMSKKYEGSPEELAMLKGARIVTTSETKKKYWLDTARVKPLIGGDPITACYKYGHYFTFIPEFKIVMATNNLPNIDDDGHGMWRKIKKIPFNHTFDEANQIKDYEKELIKEASGFLNVIIQGCLEWQRDGLKSPPEVIEATQEYKEAQDTFMGFIKTVCEINKDPFKNYKESNDDIYSTYMKYCNELGLISDTKNTVIKKLKEKLLLEPTMTGPKNARARGFKGIRIKNNDEELDNEQASDGCTGVQGVQKSQEFSHACAREKSSGNSVQPVHLYTSESDEEKSQQEKAITIRNTIKKMSIQNIGTIEMALKAGVIRQCFVENKIEKEYTSKIIEKWKEIGELQEVIFEKNVYIGLTS
jgi:putative DNA primase/helicase